MLKHILEQREPVRECLLTELFVAMMVLSSRARLPGKRTAKIAQGLGAYFLLGVLIRAGHSYFGVCRESPAFVVLSHLRMAVYLACVNYWIISLWPEKRRGPNHNAGNAGKSVYFANAVEIRSSGFGIA
jgi:hypothetical protein